MPTSSVAPRPEYCQVLSNHAPVGPAENLAQTIEIRRRRSSLRHSFHARVRPTPRPPERPPRAAGSGRGHRGDRTPRRRARAGRPAAPPRGAAASCRRRGALARLGRTGRGRCLRSPGSGGTVAAPGDGRRRGARRPARRAVDRHRVRQVAGLPAPGAHGDPVGAGSPRAARRRGALPRADQGPGPGPARLPPGPGPRRAGDHPRRGQQSRAAGLGARLRRVPPDQPRHAAPLDAAGAPSVGAVLVEPPVRRRRRVPPLPRRLRGARRPGPAPVAAGRRARTARPPPSCWPPQPWPSPSARRPGSPASTCWP